MRYITSTEEIYSIEDKATYSLRGDISKANELILKKYIGMLKKEEIISESEERPFRKSIRKELSDLTKSIAVFQSENKEDFSSGKKEWNITKRKKELERNYLNYSTKDYSLFYCLDIYKSGPNNIDLVFNFQNSFEKAVGLESIFGESTRGGKLKFDERDNDPDPEELLSIVLGKNKLVQKYLVNLLEPNFDGIRWEEHDIEFHLSKLIIKENIYTKEKTISYSLNMKPKRGLSQEDFDDSRKDIEHSVDLFKKNQSRNKELSEVKLK